MSNSSVRCALCPTSLPRSEMVPVRDAKYGRIRHYRCPRCAEAAKQARKARHATQQ